MRRMRVLVTDGEQRAALAVVRSLGRAGHDVLVCSRSGRSLAGSSRHARRELSVPDPLGAPDAFGSAVANSADANSIEVLVPITEAALRVLLPLRERLAPILLPFPDAEAFSRVSDKAILMEAARKAGIAVPDQVTLRSPQESVVSELAFPLVLKPAVSVASEGGRASR